MKECYVQANDLADRHPNVLLLGNGLIRAFAGISWADMIQKISTNQRIGTYGEDFANMPFPLQVVLATEDKVDAAIRSEDNKALFCGARDEDMEGLRPYLKRLLSLDFDHYLTTNYSYELERTADDKIDNTGKRCARLMQHTEAVERAEAKYLLHTYNAVRFGEHEKKIWHIHGEARKPNSVILGHYYYGKYLAKIQNYLEWEGNKQQLREKAGESIYIGSWVDSFIMGNVYILGYGFDLSEMDLWWLLNRKKRENASVGKTVFYELAGKAGIKHELLRTYGVEIRTPECGSTPNYKTFYENAIRDIERELLK